MEIILSIFVCVALFALSMLIFKVKQTVRELKEAVHQRRYLLLNKSSALLQQLGFEALVTETNELVDNYNNCAEAQSDRLNQLEATLGSIQESVIIFSGQRVIEYANQSAQRLFRQGAALKGLRLESVLRSPSLIEFLNADRAEDYGCHPQQIFIEQMGKIFWFEISCAEVRGVSAPNEISTLLVLHDITRLKRLEQIRREFVANVSHELRTPLTIIKGYAETLLEDNAELPSETRERFLNKIARNTQRLHLLVEDLLMLSRLESKPDQIKPAVQSLRQVLDEALEDYLSRLVAERQKIVLEFDDRIQEFAFDRFSIQQVFDNLIENAFKYATNFTLIKIGVKYDEATNTVQCSVSDDGPGIPEKDLPHIFERFYRVDKGRSYESGGTGLGLSIVKHIIQQHGGTVSAESAPGKGASIYFDLPYEQSLNSARKLQNSK